MAPIARFASICSLLAVLIVPASAAANPAVEACAGKKEGDGCGLMKLVKPEGGGELQRKTVPGACRPDECCDLDYSKGSPPETVCHACLACKEGPADVTAPASDGEAKADSAQSTEPPRAGDGPPAPTPSQRRGCSVGVRPRAPIADWLALLPLLGVAAVRRRR